MVCRVLLAWGGGLGGRGEAVSPFGLTLRAAQLSHLTESKIRCQGRMKGRKGGRTHCYSALVSAGHVPGPEVLKAGCGLSCGRALGLWRTPTPILLLTQTSLSPHLLPASQPSSPPFSLGTVPYTRGRHDGV